MDKEATKKILAGEGVLMPRSVVVGNNYTAGDLRRIKLPAVVKPVHQGSSVGTFIVKNQMELPRAVKEAFKFGPKVMVEEFISGREITAAVLGNEKPQPLPLIEIKPKVSHFFDYRAKYEVGGSEEICPAPIGKSITKKIQDTAARVHRVIGCRGVTRSDFILRGSRPYFLEINTIPGMTETSLVPQAAAKAGISFPELLDKLIELAVEQQSS
jgi:D-alanine-D-alanine ligase